MRNSILLVIGFLFSLLASFSQEIKAKVVVNTNLIPSTIEREIFVSLQSDLNNFLNNKKWTNVTFKEHERIECQFFLNMKSVVSENVYSATLVIQAKRPIYGTDYSSTLLNQSDGDFTFSYIKNQFVDFNEFRVQGNDPLVANLTAVFAYYVYLILGLDFDTYSLKGGAPYFEKAFFVANNAPQKTGSIGGWEPTGPRTNRFWIAENFFSANYNLMHDVLYQYYRSGMDMLVDSPAKAKENIYSAVQKTYKVFKSYPGVAITTMFIQPRTEEIVKIFASSDKQTKEKLSPMLQSIDLPSKNLIQKTLE